MHPCYQLVRAVCVFRQGYPGTFIMLGIFVEEREEGTTYAREEGQQLITLFTGEFRKFKGKYPGGKRLVSKRAALTTCRGLFINSPALAYL
nr:MAG TPA: hypothetical protein [Caudoviricetes sp.]